MAREKGKGRRVLEYLKEHVGEDIPLRNLYDLVGEGEWKRDFRKIRKGEGYDVIIKREGINIIYSLANDTPTLEPIKRGTISDVLRYSIPERDNHTCHSCGKSVLHDGIVLVIDHIKPVEAGGDYTK